MAYTHRNFKTGADLKRAFFTGDALTAFQPGPFGSDLPDGDTVIEGPHYPAPHRFYVRATVKAGRVVALPGSRAPKPRVVKRVEECPAQNADPCVRDEEGICVACGGGS